MHIYIPSHLLNNIDLSVILLYISSGLIPSICESLFSNITTTLILLLSAVEPVDFDFFLDSTIRKKIHYNLYKKQDYLFNTIII
jgi:hypothetical protein